MLYLFVVMLLNLKHDERYHRQWPVAAASGPFLVLEAVVLTLAKGRTAVARPAVSEPGTRGWATRKPWATSCTPPISFPLKSHR